MAVILTHPAPARRDAPILRRGRSERWPEAYPLGYVEGLSDVRTKQAVIFSVSLMDVVGNVHQ